MSFAKKYDPKEIEIKIRKFWDEKKIYKFDENTKKTIFSIDTPPPTISGKMHIGHAFSYTQTDFIARYKRMNNFEVFYPFGTDDNGLATEKLVQKEKKVNLRKVSRDEAVKITMDFLEKERPKFIQDFKNIGLSCDFNLNYLTISPYSQKISQESFLELAKKGFAYRKEGPVPWDRVFQTPIAQAELEDLERYAFLNYVKAKIEGTKNTYMIYATTRPELCYAVVGMSVEDVGEYVKLKIGDEYWITGASTYAEKFSNFNYEIVETLTGQDIIGEKVKIPMVNRVVEISHDISVKADFGTGIAYFCTYGGLEDIEWAVRHNVTPVDLLNIYGKLNEKGGKYEGLLAEDARKKIIEDMEKNKSIIFKEEKIQIVNVGERSGKEVEFIVSNQWYIKYLDKKEYFWEKAQGLNWYPDHMKHRVENWIKGLNWDWGFTRQRHFGIPIPVWYGEKSGKIYFPSKEDLPIDPINDKPKIKKNIYFIRHGEYENNLKKRMNHDPSKKISLTKNGILQAKKISKDFVGINFDKIISSDFLRCNETAKIISNKKQIEKNSVLNELKISKEGDSYKENRRRIKSQIIENKVLNGDENLKERIEKLKFFLNELKKSSDQNILIVTHKDVIRLIKIINLNLDLKEFYNYNPQNCDIYEINYDLKINEKLIADTDVLDTWFTSASTPILAGNLVKNEEIKKKLFPMDLRPQGHDIINFWLFYTLAKTNLICDKNPWKNVAISGWVLDPKGKKMSKSKGNTISPQEVVEKFSNDAIRFAAGSTKLGQDISYPQKEVQTGIKVVNKLFNANKFASMLLENFSSKNREFDFDKLKSIDKWIIAKMQNVIKISNEGFKNYDYSKARAQFMDYFMRDIADNYIEIVKTRLWNPNQFKEDTKLAQKALYYSLFNSLKGLAPFIPYITEEIYQNFYKKFEKNESIHICSYPKYEKKYDNLEIIELGDKFVEIVGKVRKYKSEKQISIKEELEKIEISCDNKLKEFIEDSIKDLKAVTSVKKIVFKIGVFDVKIN